MHKITSSAARLHWARTLGRVEHRGTRFAILRNGKLVAALIPYEESEILRRLDDEIDFQAAREAVEAERGVSRLSWEDLLSYAGLES